VDLLRRVAQLLADLRARRRLRQAAHDLHALWLEQRLGLLDPLDVQQLLHPAHYLYVKKDCPARRSSARVARMQDRRTRAVRALTNLNPGPVTPPSTAPRPRPLPTAA